MPVSERAALLRAELLQSPLDLIPVRSVTQAIHDLKLLKGAIEGLLEMYDAAVARGENDITLAKGAITFFSPIECRLLAWRRGGHREWVRVRAAQKARKPWL